MNFTWQALESAAEGLKHLQNQVRGLDSSRKLGFFARLFGKNQVNSKFKNIFLEAINDDLNMPRALAAALELLKSDLPDEEKLATILDFDKVLGLGLKNLGKAEKTNIPDEINKLVKARLEARQEKNWAEADRLRLEIEKMGYMVEDTKDGQRISKKF